MKRPLILVPCSEQNLSGDPKRLYINRAYATSIERAGGVVLAIARPSEEAVDQLIALADGLYLTGGTDIDPKWYGEEGRGAAHNDTPDEGRDALEFLLIKKALLQRMPIIGICRGMQNLNVHFGGTLYQDLKKDFGKEVDHDHRNVVKRETIAHKVILEKNTRYGAIIGDTVVDTNSMHHQGIKDLGRDITITARTADGLVEGIEFQDSPFCIGVQWHPEELADVPSQKLFSAFIASCKEYQKIKTGSIEPTPFSIDQKYVPLS